MSPGVIDEGKIIKRHTQKKDNSNDGGGLPGSQVSSSSFRKTSCDQMGAQMNLESREEATTAGRRERKKKSDANSSEPVYNCVMCRPWHEDI
jgi:hypothetical protein